MHEYDKSSKWLIQHHGDSILRLAGVRNIVVWRPLQAGLECEERIAKSTGWKAMSEVITYPAPDLVAH